MPEDLRALAAAHGVLTSYVDHGKSLRFADRDVVVAVLEALGSTSAGRNPGAALAERREQDASRMLEPVMVLGSGTTASIGVTVSTADVKLDCTLELEDGQVLEWFASLDARAHESGSGAKGGPQTVQVELPMNVGPGYHVLHVRSRSREARCVILAKPKEGARGRFGDTWRAIGIAAPVFTLHSERSWGCGDLSDLDTLAEIAAVNGASVVSTLPLLAGPGPEPFEASPYLPLSRQFWHDRWIDVDAVPDLAASASAAPLAREARRVLRDAAERSHPYVDGASALAAKRAVLSILSGELSAHREVGLESFLADRPGLVEYARFRAAGERFGPQWRSWPASLCAGSIDPTDVDEATVRYHTYAQWLAHEQLRTVSERCERRGQVLSLDLPLGVHAWGYDIWRHRHQFVEGISVGSPPDRFFPRGQRWSFPPPRVDAMRADGHGLFRAAIVHHLNVAGMLRIDHVIGMQRLFWIPDGSEPADGVYVESPLEELLAVVAIEAQRHRAAIVGEDLGTVDAAVRRAMLRDGIRRTFVVELSVELTGPSAVAPPPSGAVASFATHDLPTFSGWWQARDIAERVALGQVDEPTGASMLAERMAERSRLATLAPTRDAVLDDGNAAPREVMTAAIDLLARSDAGLVVAQLDDLVGESEAVNLPGTSVERPNWRRRTSKSLEEIATDAGVRASMASLVARRPREAPSGAGRGGRTVETLFDVSKFGDLDEHLFREGRHSRLYDKLGAHEMTVDGRTGRYFAVWAPNAAWVEVIGDFNGWDGHRHPLARRESIGVWEGFVPGLGSGERYKFRLASTLGGEIFDKADPFARGAELPPRTASVTTTLRHEWADAAWMAERGPRQGPDRPISVYEVHLGSWRVVPEEDDRSLTYRELAAPLIDHVRRHGFTHVEFMPVMQHPFYGSWGYHVTGFFAPSSRYGSADDFAALVDALHIAGVGVLLDWVPAHFPADAFALARFDGTHLFEHADPRQGLHPDWNSLIFNYGRHEVRSFLTSAACYWLDLFHIDGMRFDAVASMLYLDYSRAPGEWVPNRLGGRENLDAIEFLTTCNDEIHRSHPGTITIAEESTSWPGVTAPVESGGLGFDYKWDLGWMHDTLEYLAKDPVHRRWHHDQLTFRSVYATTEQFVLPLSHDEVVHGKGSLLARMPGDTWQRFANLRLLYGFMHAQPGKKLLFMGDEFAQLDEWAHDSSLDWHLLDLAAHRGVAALVTRLNELYTTSSALHRDDLGDRGFAWIATDDREQSVACIERFDDAGTRLVFALNATPEPRHDYVVGMPAPGTWSLQLTSDASEFGGSDYPVLDTVETTHEPRHGRPDRASLVLPPLGFVIYRHDN